MKLRSFSGICREIGGTDKTDEPRKIKHICDFSRCRLNVRVKALASSLCSEATNMLYLSFWVLLAGRSGNPLKGFRVSLKNHSSNLHASIYGIFLFSLGASICLRQTGIYYTLTCFPKNSAATRAIFFSDSPSRCFLSFACIIIAPIICPLLRIAWQICSCSSMP